MCTCVLQVAIKIIDKSELSDSSRLKVCSFLLLYFLQWWLVYRIGTVIKLGLQSWAFSFF